MNDATLSSDENLKRTHYKMTVNEKSKTIDDKQLRFHLYHQEMLVSTNLYLARIFYRKKLLEKATTIKRFSHLTTVFTITHA